MKMGAAVPSWLVNMLKATANLIEAAGGQNVTEDEEETALLDQENRH